MKRLFAVASLALISCACASRGPTPLTTSLLGAPLAAPERSAPTERWLQLEIDAATAKWHLAPSETSAIWVGRRLAYKSMFPEAIAWYEGAIETYPESYRLRRHVGHRMLTLRRIDAAVEILTAARELAAQLGLPPTGLAPATLLPIDGLATAQCAPAKRSRLV